ncbi:hypothetical protein [Peptacetobacter hiranonis]|uniref:hypothetical protein n=1 Tax=Peptacetobacter hiranonis TaxID=89152 RepID=UPI0022E36A80|nr:hypothetical protein [Peptacetobacter hiranonis]
MNIEQFTKDTLNSLQSELSSVIESVRKIKFSGNTLYIISDIAKIDEQISPEIIEMIKTYIVAKSGISYGINIVFLSEDDIIELGLRKIAEIQLSKNYQNEEKSEEDDSTIEVKRPEHEEKQEEKKEYKEEADINRIDAMDVWKVMLGRIQELISPAVYKALFKDSKQIDYQMGTVVVRVGDVRVVQIMETQYLRFLQDVSEELFGVRLGFKFVVDDKKEERSKKKDEEEVYPASMNDLNDFFSFLNSLYNK